MAQRGRPRKNPLPTESPSGEKKKVGRPRKTPIVELHPEIKQITEEVKQKAEEFNVIEEEHIIKENNQEKYDSNIKPMWDYAINDEFEYFDATKSYELTGYRPINRTEGLDFDPNWFTETREVFLKTGHYCAYPRNTKAYNDFWDEQYRRCQDGMTVNDYTITGDHYFFLNFYQLMDLKSAKKAGSSRIYDFPKFYVGQYQFFHYIELAKRIRKNAVLMKARGIN